MKQWFWSTGIHCHVITSSATAISEMWQFFQLAVANALRYFPCELHAQLAEEFLRELKEHGHIYMYRYCTNVNVVASHSHRIIIPSYQSTTSHHHTLTQEAIIISSNRRFRPTEYEMKAWPINQYPARCTGAAAIMLMIQNNLDTRVPSLSSSTLHHSIAFWRAVIR